MADATKTDLTFKKDTVGADARTITVDSPFDGVTVQTLVNAVREYEAGLDYLDREVIITATGKDTIVTGSEFVGITLTMINDWRVAFAARAGPTYEPMSVKSGNLIAVNSFDDNPIYATAFTQVTIRQSQSPTILYDQYQGYADGSVWIDTVNGTAGTVAYDNGTVESPVNNLADALTIAASIGLTAFHVVQGSSLTFSGSVSGKKWIGFNWDLNLNGADVSDCHIDGARVAGTANAATTSCHFYNCRLRTSISSQAMFIGTDAELGWCGVSASATYPIQIGGASGDTIFHDCYSEVAGQTEGLVVDFQTTVGVDSRLSVRRYSGGLAVLNLGQAGTDSVSIEGDGHLFLAASCVGGEVAVRGNIQLTDNSSGVTIYQDARVTQSTPLTVGTIQTDVIDAVALADSGLAEIADKILGRNIAGGADGGRDVTSALRRIRNRNRIVGSTLTVYEEDDATTDHTAVVTTGAGNPITEIDPA